MRRLVIASLVLAGSIVLPGYAGAESQLYGRQLATAKKQLHNDQKEVEQFQDLLEELDKIHLPREINDFAAINARIWNAMRREHEQSQALIGDDAEPTRRMHAIIMEARGLQRLIGSGEVDAAPRNRALLEEFLDLLRADIDARAAALAGR